MYIAPGQGLTTPKGQNSLSLCPFVASLKKSLWSLIFLLFFMCVFSNVHSPRHGADNPLRTKILWQQKGLFSLPIRCKFQNDLFKIWFYTHFLIILYMYIAPKQGQTNPWGQNFYVNRKLFPTEKVNGISEKFHWNFGDFHRYTKFQWNFTEIPMTKVRSLKFQWNSSHQDKITEISVKFQWPR